MFARGGLTMLTLTCVSLALVTDVAEAASRKKTKADAPEAPAAESAPSAAPVATPAGTAPAAGLSVVEEGGKRYVLMADGVVEVWSIGATPERLGTIQAPGAVALFSGGGRVWAEVREVRAVPVDGAAPAVAAVAAVAPGADAKPAQPQPPAKAAAPVIRTVSVSEGNAVVDAGSAAGLVLGAHVRFLRVESYEVPKLDGSGMETRAAEEEIGSGVVQRVEADRAVVEIARGGRVVVGDRLDTTPSDSPDVRAPRRFAGFREIGGVVRPMLPLDTLGVAMVNEAWITVGYEQPWYVTARLAPVAMGWSTDGNPFTVAALASAGFDTRYYGAGAGIGWSMLNVNSGVPDISHYDEGTTTIQGDFQDVSSAFSFVQEARLGARDGLRLEIRNTLVIRPSYEVSETYEERPDPYNPDYTVTYTTVNVTEGPAEIAFGGLSMDLNVPVGSRSELFGDFGFGESGAMWFEAGVGTWLRGNGDVGSLGLRVGAGGASVTGTPNQGYVSLGGPMVSVGARYRF
jgi:hypothetical protein